MGAVIAFLTSRWFLTGIGAAVLAALAWFLGPLLSFLEDWPIRLGIVLLIALVWRSVRRPPSSPFMSVRESGVRIRHQAQ